MIAIDCVVSLLMLRLRFPIAANKVGPKTKKRQMKTGDWSQMPKPAQQSQNTISQTFTKCNTGDYLPVTWFPRSKSQTNPWWFIGMMLTSLPLKVIKQNKSQLDSGSPARETSDTRHLKSFGLASDFDGDRWLMTTEQTLGFKPASDAKLRTESNARWSE